MECRFLAGLLLLACAGRAPVETSTSVPVQPPPERINLSAQVELARAVIEVPAMSIGLIHGEELVAWGVAGERAAGSGEAAQLTDRWHIGSNTKAMTAHLVAVLVSEGVLSWETTVAEVFADLNPAPGWGEVSILDLCRHRSGLERLKQQNLLFMMVSDQSPRALRQAWVEKTVLSDSPAAEKDFAYANSNYMLAGAMLESLMDESWEELMRARVFAPLEMHGAGFGPPGSDQPLGHQMGPDGDWRAVPLGPRADNPPALGPAGTVHIDHLSWTPYLAAHLNLARGEPGPLSDPTFASLHTLPEGGDYAAGWGVREPPEGLTGPMLWHRGSNTMWLSYVALLPAMDVAFICNANVGATNPVTEQCEGLLVKALDALN